VVRIKRCCTKRDTRSPARAQHLRDEGKTDKTKVTLPFPTNSPGDLRTFAKAAEILTIFTAS